MIRLRVEPWPEAAGLVWIAVASTPGLCRPCAFVAWESLGTSALEGKKDPSDVPATSLAPSPCWPPSSSFLSTHPWRVPVHCIVTGPGTLQVQPSISQWTGTSLVILWKLGSLLGVLSLLNKGN